MKRRTKHQGQYSERADFFILFLAGIYNLIFVDISILGMPLRTLILLLAEFLCLAVHLYKKEDILPRWSENRIYDRTITLLLAIVILLTIAFSLAESDHFWICVDLLALLLLYPCLHGRKRFPQEIFGVYSAGCYVTCILLLCYYLADGGCEPFIALLLQNHTMESWLVLGITMNTTAYCVEESGQIWYGGNILIEVFLLLIQKNILAMAVVGLVPLLLPVFCRPSKTLSAQAAQAAFLYGFLVCNMSLITGYTPLLLGIVTYDLELSVYMELLLAVAGVCFFYSWDRYTQGVDPDTTLPGMRAWYRKAATVYVVGIWGIWAASKCFSTDRMAKLIISDAKENDIWQSGLFGQMGKQFGLLGIVAACSLVYIGIVRLYQSRKWRVKAHKLYRLFTAVCLLQAVFLPQTMAALPVYVMFWLLFMGTDEKQIHRIPMVEGVEDKDETDNTDTLLQRGGDAGDRTE